MAIALASGGRPSWTMILIESFSVTAGGDGSYSSSLSKRSLTERYKFSSLMFLLILVYEISDPISTSWKGFVNWRV